MFEGTDITGVFASYHLPDFRLLVERARPELEVEHLARRPLAGFHMERGAGAHRRVESFAFPAGLRIIDASIHPLRVETQWIWNSQHDPLPVLQSQQPFGR